MKKKLLYRWIEYKIDKIVKWRVKHFSEYQFDFYSNELSTLF